MYVMKSLINQEVLKDMIVHTKKDYCEQCDKNFVGQGGLKRHVLMLIRRSIIMRNVCKGFPVQRLLEDIC